MMMAYCWRSVLQGVIGGLFALPFGTGFLFWCHIFFFLFFVVLCSRPVFLGWPFPVLAIALSALLGVHLHRLKITDFY
jgi:hypothetical protein